MSRSPCRVSCLLALALAAGAVAPASAAPPDTLCGLWSASKWFGPAARGALIVTKNGASYAADIAGFRVPVRLERGELRFELPGDRGSFRGRPREGAIHGHWVGPPNSAVFTGGRSASRVHLSPDGPDRWSGTVAPPEDRFSFQLLVEPRADGTLRAVLRNPDRDLGTWLGVESLARDGANVRLVGRRAGQKEAGTAASGTYDAERDVITLVFPNRGGSYDFRRDDESSNYYPRGRHPARYEYAPPSARDDGWPTGTLADAAIDRAAISRLVQWIVDMPMDSAMTPQFHGLLIARHGKLVLEEYFHGENRDQLHDTRSASKSLTAIVVGAAIEGGVPLALSSPVYRVMNGGTFPSDLEPRKRAMTLEHLLTMSSGWFCDDTNPDAPGNEENMLDQENEPDYYRYTLAVPMATDPGEKSVYCSCQPNVALGMVARAGGESALDVFDRFVGEPMKIERYSWSLDPAGNPYGGGSVNLLPRDFLKLGQLMLNGGTWNGRRILARDFAARAVAPLYHNRNITYGYLWWGIDYPYKNRTVHAFFASGAGGQGVIVVPELDLAVAIFGANYSAGRIQIRDVQELVPRFVLPAVREPGDDPSAKVAERAFTTPYGKSADGSRVK